MVFVLLLFSRSWWLNEMPHPVAAQDGVLFVSAYLQERVCLKTVAPTAFVVIPSFLFFSWDCRCSQITWWFGPWTPNYLAGPNQGAYLLGLLFLIAFAWF